MYAEAQDSCRIRDRGQGSVVPVPMAGGGGDGDDARERGFLLTNAQGLRRGRRDVYVQSTAQCLARGRAGRQRVVVQVHVQAGADGNE